MNKMLRNFIRQRFRSTISVLSNRTQLHPVARPSSSNSSIVLSAKRYVHQGITLCKYNKKQSSKIEDESDDENELKFEDERDSKVLKTKVNSLRADLLLRVGLGMARNKIENAFYDSRIRVNGEKLQKKSEQVEVDDEIDVIKGFSQANPTHLMVSRIVLLAADPREESVSVQLRRYKSLLIENYSGLHAYKAKAANE